MKDFAPTENETRGATASQVALLVRMAEIQTEQVHIREKQEEFSEKLFGNGQPGLVEEVRSANQWIEGKKKLESVFLAAFLTTIGASILAVLAAGVSIIWRVR